MQAIKPVVKEQIFRSLRAGVVPRIGQQYIQVGREPEVTALIKDIDNVAEGGSAIRFIIGEYGSGKTFFLNLVRAIALQKGLVTSSVDLSPNKRLYSKTGQAKALYTELIRNLSTRTRQDGNAIEGIIQKFLSACSEEAETSGQPVRNLIVKKLNPLTELPNGYDFQKVLLTYYAGYERGNDDLCQESLRWLCGEYSSKLDAKRELDVRTIINDENYYTQLKLFARFVRIAGYKGLFLCLDEMVNIYKIQHPTTRNSNYEQLLGIVNDALQGESVGLGLIFGGTPEFHTDTHRGMFSYEALRSRLAGNSFAKNGIVDFSGPVIALQRLDQNDVFVLLDKIRLLYANNEENKTLLPKEAIEQFMNHCNKSLGSTCFRTPRNIITTFIHLLDVLDQNPESKWQDFIGSLEVVKDDYQEPDDIDDDLVSF